MPKYKCLLSYDGTEYSGWQIQPNAPSIQGTIETLLQDLFHTPIRVIGAGRTDAGVHALGQVAHFEMEKRVDPYRLRGSLNSLLPKSIRIREMSYAPPSFHAQYSAERKIYHYHLWLKETADPFIYPYRHRPRFPISLPLLKEAAAHFVGTHDFSTFANVGSSAGTSIRTLYRLDLVEQEGGARLEFEGNGFLYKMVRNIVGTLLEVASNKRPLREIPHLFNAKDRRAAGVPSPPQGLFLMHICYSGLNFK